MGLRAGDTITAREAVRALIVKSANDVATAVAEHMAGSEKKFAREMTRKARQLSMFDTVFVNASGLHNKRQKTTARDMARLAARLLKRFPHFEPFWNTRYFDHDGKRYYSHNRLLGRLPGAIGMKTGYIRAAGYNIASVVERGGRRVIAVVIGGRSVAGRDNRVVSLVERHMRRASKAYHKSGISKRQHRLAAAWGNATGRQQSQSCSTGRRGTRLANSSWRLSCRRLGAFASRPCARRDRCHFGRRQAGNRQI